MVTRLAFGICAVGLLADGWLTTTPMAQAQELWPLAEPADRPEPILELPLGPAFDAGATLRASIHGRRVMNGVSGYDPRYYDALKSGLAAHDPALLAAVASLGPIDIVVDGAADPDGAYARYAASAPGAAQVRSDGTRAVYRVPRAATPPALGPAWPIRTVRALRHRLDWPLMYDGKDSTGWTDIPQKPDQWITVDLGEVREVGGVTHVIGDFYLDYPRRLAIDGSTDGQSWELAWEGPSYAQTFLAFVRDPRNAALEFGFRPRPARFVRLRQLESSTTAWRVSELRVHAPGTPHRGGE